MSTPVNQTHPALVLLAQRPDLFRRQGAVVATWRQAGQRKLGPYYQLTYREEGRQRWVYLGQAMELVEAVRQTLDRLQGFLRQWRLLERIRRRTLAVLRLQKARFNARLREVGLRLQGCEVRGWRTSELGQTIRAAMRARLWPDLAARDQQPPAMLAALGIRGLTPFRPLLPPSPTAMIERMVRGVGDPFARGLTRGFLGRLSGERS